MLQETRIVMDLSIV